LPPFELEAPIFAEGMSEISILDLALLAASWRPVLMRALARSNKASLPCAVAGTLALRRDSEPQDSHPRQPADHPGNSRLSVRQRHKISLTHWLHSIIRRSAIASASREIETLLESKMTSMNILTFVNHK
jgi:hypothetical protein